MRQIVLSIVLALSSAGCVVAHQDHVECGIHASAYRGECECDDGYSGDPYDACVPLMSWLLTDSCDDDADIEYRFFALQRDWVWPDDGSFFSTGFGEDSWTDIACEEGDEVCFGGQSGEFAWGIGLDGEDPCDACCWACEPGVIADVGYLTCE